MDFAFTEEQQMLKEQARSFLADKWPPDILGAIESRDWDRELWRSMGELGWVGLASDEAAGGGGMSFLEEAVLFEEMGYALYAGPYFSTVALGLPALARSPETIARVLGQGGPVTLAWAEPRGPFTLDTLDSLNTKAEPADGGWVLTGEKHLVPDAHVAETIVVAAQSPEGVGLWAAPPSGGSPAVRVLQGLDATRPVARVVFQDVVAEQVAAPADAMQLLPEIRLRALAATALEAVGIAQRALDLGVRYVRERKQFDRPIGVYQAVSHQLSDTYVETELARSLAYWAAWCVARDDSEAPVAVAAAKAAATEAAIAACERSIQVHGGIGFTWEHVLHRYLKRAQWIASFEGSAADHRGAIASALLD